ncbi:ABC transporter substrate-binding protein [Robertmurraya sp. 2P01SA]|uniref:ABC transporter substrate-binding protein n=2 Tax=Robertmurraya TaxID=2837507 RepID=UPI0039A4EEE1
MSMNKKIVYLFMLMLSLIVAGCNGGANEASNENGENIEKTTGGELRAALGQQPETLDPQISTGATVKYVTRHIFESLLTLDSNFQPVPELAESYEKSEDGLTYTFKLRENVTFHNGKPMMAEDVVASMNRWKEQSAVAQQILGEGAIFEEVDEYTVELKLEAPRLTAVDAIASPKQFAGIMPKEVIESAPAEGIEEYIGTGPFKFEEWKQDQYIHLSKYEEYEPVDLPSDGLSGKKEALVDDLYFEIVTDPSTQLSGLQTGQYDVAYSLPNDNYEQLKNDENLKTYTDLYGNGLHHFNKKEGIFTNPKMREAVNAAVNNDEIMLGGWAHEDLYEVDAGFMANSQVWYSEAGAEQFNQADPEKAKKLLAEVGYNGEEVVIMTNSESELYNMSVVFHEQLKKIGMNVKLEVLDRATYSERRTDPANWDLLSVGLSTVTTPSQHLSLSATWPGWTDDAKVAEMLDAIEASPTLDDALVVWEELQAYLWTDYLPGIKHGDYFYYLASSSKVDGLTIFEGPILWNTSVSK